MTAIYPVPADNSISTEKIQDGAVTLAKLGDDVELGGGGAVDSVNGETGDVVLNAFDVGADPAGSAAAVAAGAQPLDSDLTAIAALTTTTFGRALLALADAAAGRTALGLGTAATAASADFQPVDSDLTSIAALSTTSFGRALLTQADAAAVRTYIGAAGSGGASGLALMRTAVKTGAYTAAAGDLVPCDPTGGAFTVTLPNAPADKTAVAVKIVTATAPNAISVACAGADTFNRATGTPATSLNLTLPGQAVLLTYDSGAKVWTILADDLPLSQLDARYAAAGAGGSLLPGASSATVTQAGDGTPTITFASPWGITSGGVPYYDPAGAVSAEAGVLGVAADGSLTVTQIQGQVS